MAFQLIESMPSLAELRAQLGAYGVQGPNELATEVEGPELDYPIGRYPSRVLDMVDDKDPLQNLKPHFLDDLEQHLEQEIFPENESCCCKPAALELSCVYGSK